MIDAKKIVEVALKSMTAKESPCKAFSLARVAFMKTLEKVDREAKTVNGSAVVAAAEVRAPAPPLFTICKQTWPLPENEVNISTSMFEAKVGVRVATIKAMLGCTPNNDVKIMQKTQKAIKDMTKHLTVHQTGTTPVTDQPHMKTIAKELRKGYDVPCRL